MMINPVKNSPPTLIAAKGIALCCLFALPVLTVRLAALVFSIFGNCGKNLSKKTTSLANRMYAILITHNSLDATSLFESNVLCRIKNIAKKNSIWHQKDIKKTKELIQLATDKNECEKKGLSFLEAEDLERLKNYSPQGADENGICFGASLSIIHNLLSHNIQSEKDLIQHLYKYRNGFSSKAAALQNLQMILFESSTTLTEKEKASLDREIEVSKQAFIAETEEKERQLNEKKNNLSREEYSTQFLRIIKEVEESIPHKVEKLQKNVRKFYQYKNKTDRIRRIAALIDLNLKSDPEKWDQTFFTNMMRDNTVQKRFNQLELGYYQLSFNVDDKTGHGIVYIKEKFGSYLIDPNFGLFKCNSENPSTNLCELFKRHYKGKKIDKNEKEQFLEIYQFSKI